jgi:hypothetical protein
LHCLDTATGELIWTRRYGQGLWHQFLVADETSVFVMDGKWHFTAFDLDSGATRWLGRLRSPGCWQPVWCGAFLAVLSRQGHLAVFDPARELKVWEGVSQAPITSHRQIALDGFRKPPCWLPPVPRRGCWPLTSTRTTPAPWHPHNLSQSMPPQPPTEIAFV